jgi:hypothetical protein
MTINQSVILPFDKLRVTIQDFCKSLIPVLVFWLFLKMGGEYKLFPSHDGGELLRKLFISPSPNPSHQGRGNYPTVTSKSTPICHPRKRSASGIFLQTKKDSGQAGMTDKKLKTKKRLLQQRVSFNNDMTVTPRFLP